MDDHVVLLRRLLDADVGRFDAGEVTSAMRDVARLHGLIATIDAALVRRAAELHRQGAGAEPVAHSSAPDACRVVRPDGSSRDQQ